MKKDMTAISLIVYGDNNLLRKINISSTNTLIQTFNQTILYSSISGCSPFIIKICGTNALLISVKLFG
jgi:hypothetical protein